MEFTTDSRACQTLLTLVSSYKLPAASYKLQATSCYHCQSSQDQVHLRWTIRYPDKGKPRVIVGPLLRSKRCRFELTRALRSPRGLRRGKATGPHTKVLWGCQAAEGKLPHFGVGVAGLPKEEANKASVTRFCYYGACNGSTDYWAQGFHND